MTDDLISRDECRRRVGEAFYQQGFLGPASDEEWNLAREHGPEITLLTVEETLAGVATKHILRREIVRPSPPAITDKLALAVGRNILAAAQGRTIDHWLALYGFDPSERDVFSRADFEDAMAGLLGQAIAEVRAQILGVVPGDSDADQAQAAQIERVMRMPLGAHMTQPPRRSRGRPQDVRPGIIEKMKADLDAGLSSDDLRDFPEEALAARYSANRETVRRAREEVLSEIVGK